MISTAGPLVRENHFTKYHLGMDGIYQATVEHTIATPRLILDQAFNSMIKSETSMDTVPPVRDHNLRRDSVTYTVLCRKCLSWHQNFA